MRRAVREGSGICETIAQSYRHIFIDRAGVRLLFLHAQLRQQIENDARFHLKFPRQLVDSDFFHRRDCYVTPYTTTVCSWLMGIPNVIRFFTFR
jgi:hypothetical protein